MARMDQVPLEIWQLIMAKLSKSDMKSLRQTCKFLAAYGIPTLFTSFHFHLRLQKKNIQQMEEMIQRPDIMRYLDTVVCETGVLHESSSLNRWKMEITRDDFHIWKRATGSSIDSRNVEEFEKITNKLFRKRFERSIDIAYAKLRKRLEEEALEMVQCRDRILELMAKLIPKKGYRINMNRRTISIEELKDVEVAPGFNPRELADAMAHQADYDRYRKAIFFEHIKILLLAASKTIDARPHTKLILEDFPTELFRHWQGDNISGLEWPPTLPPSAVGLKSIHFWFWAFNCQNIDVRFSSMPFQHNLINIKTDSYPSESRPIRRRLGCFDEESETDSGDDDSDIDQKASIETDSPSNKIDNNRASQSTVRKLGMTSNMDRQLAISFGPIAGDTEFQKVLKHFMFSSRQLDQQIPSILNRNTLIRLDLDNIVADPHDIGVFLERQPKMKHLTLRDSTMEHQSSMVTLLHVLRNGPQKLESICIEGRWPAGADWGTWKIYKPEELSDGDDPFQYPWYLKDGLRARVENFILHGGECPLPRLENDPDARNKWKSMSDGSWKFEMDRRWEFDPDTDSDDDYCSFDLFD